MLKIGISACIFSADPQRPIFKGKTLFYLEQSLAHWINSQNALAFLLPPVPLQSSVSLKDLAHEMDGLVLQGGSDVSPRTYGEEPLRPEWTGDAVRDQYEIELVKEFVAQKKPVLGVCRGAQLLNVAYGGTLYQDIPTQLKTALVHRNWEIYDQNSHSIQIENNSRLKKIYDSVLTPATDIKTNSIHHQAIKDLGRGLVVEARSVPDQIIEAIRLDSDSYVMAIQWHPEFHHPKETTLLSSEPLLRDFLDAVRKRKEINSC